MIYNRQLGEEIKISIGTAFPLEMLSSRKGTIRPIEYLYMNINTLFRNFHASFDDVVPSAPVLLEMFLEEISDIKGIVSSIHKEVIPVIYCTTGKTIGAKFKLASIKTPSTPLQIDYDNLLNSVVYHVNSMIDVEKYDMLIDGKHRPAYIISSYPTDLLSYYKFSKLELLESHTGKIKPKSQWTGKLTRNKDYADLPFNILSVQLFGDGNWFYSGGSSLIKPVLALAKECKWTSLTTMDKVKNDLKKLPESAIKAILIGMASVIII